MIPLLQFILVADIFHPGRYFRFLGGTDNSYSLTFGQLPLVKPFDRGLAQIPNHGTSLVFWVRNLLQNKYTTHRLNCRKMSGFGQI